MERRLVVVGSQAVVMRLRVVVKEQQAAAFEAMALQLVVSCRPRVCGGP
jgi:hypothetical protein